MISGRTSGRARPIRRHERKLEEASAKSEAALGAHMDDFGRWCELIGQLEGEVMAQREQVERFGWNGGLE